MSSFIYFSTTSYVGSVEMSGGKGIYESCAINIVFARNG